MTFDNTITFIYIELKVVCVTNSEDDENHPFFKICIRYKHCSLLCIIIQKIANKSPFFAIYSYSLSFIDR